MIETMTALKERGELEEYIARHDARRAHIGQVTFVTARLPG
jgi:hypothetical protein